MSHQFKPGDLAMITHESNFGRVVTVLSAHIGPCRLDFPDTRYQLIPPGSDAYVVDGEALVGVMTASGKQVIASRMAYRGKWLMLLRGDFAPEQAKSVEVPA
jgi:hypothetical protein